MAKRGKDRFSIAGNKLRYDPVNAYWLCQCAKLAYQPVVKPHVSPRAGILNSQRPTSTWPALGSSSSTRTVTGPRKLSSVNRICSSRPSSPTCTIFTSSISGGCYVRCNPATLTCDGFYPYLCSSMMLYLRDIW